eukprot:scaffold2714_cov413-Prasinococcus_capsulatus_cf.AAC.6
MSTVGRCLCSLGVLDSRCSRVYCNGEVVKTTKGTQPEYKVDIWSGNHSFYQGKQTTVVVEGGRLEKFKNKFGTHSPQLSAQRED